MATIKDVARLSGVSPTTVSHVLNNGSRTVNVHTRERVLRAIKKLDYHPSAVARALVRGRMNTLGLIQANPTTDFMTDAYYAAIIRGVLDVSLQRRQMVTFFIGGDWWDIDRSMPVFRDGRCDGLILNTSPSGEMSLMAALLNAGIPFVLAGGQDADPRISSVDTDSEGGAYALITYLLDLGHRRIGVLDWAPFNNHSITLRVGGYRKALGAAGIVPDEDVMLSGCFDEQQVRMLVGRAMGMPADRRPTALFGVDDQLAQTAMAVVREMGMRVPEDVSVVGFDDRPTSSVTDPPLTTVRQDPRAIGARATEMLLDQIEVGAPGGKKVFMPHELVVRGSAGPPRR